MLTIACAVAYTEIVARRSAYVTGTNAAEAQRLLALYGGSPLDYSDNGRAIASVVFLWPGMVFTFVRYVAFSPLPRSFLLHSFLSDLPLPLLALLPSPLSFPNLTDFLQSTYLLWTSIDHIDIYGPKSTHARLRDGPPKTVFESPAANMSQVGVDDFGLPRPEHTYARPEVNRDGEMDPEAERERKLYAAV